MDTKISSVSNSRESLVEMNRLNNISDGIFAVALTLLAFDLRLPEGILRTELPGKLLELAPKFMVYLISFVVVGGAWGSHQRMLSQIKRGDGVLVWFNLFCLLFVCLLPATAAILGRYPDAFLAITCFALDVALIQLTTLWLWRHASRQGLINPLLDPRVVLSVGRRLSLSIVIFVLSIPLSLWNPWITYLFWIGLFILLFTTDWLSWQLAAREQQTTFSLDHVQRASIHVHHEVGHLRIDSKAEDNILLDGVFGGGLESRVDRAGAAANIDLKVPERLGFLNWKYPWSWGSPSGLDWTLHLSDQIPLALEVSTSSGVSKFELEELDITDLKLRANSSETQLSLPDREGQTTVHIESKTAMLIIYVPADVAAYIHGDRDSALDQINLVRFPMIEKAGEYQSENYETASKRVDIRIDGATVAVKIV
jgi:uncharacterized membrane protein